VLTGLEASTGRVRWTLPVDSDAVPPVPPVAVRGGAVLFAGGADDDPDSSLTSYDDRTGQVRWTEALKPASYTQPPLRVSAGLVCLTADLPAGRQPAQSEWVLLGISAADGRVKWRYNPPGSLDVYPSVLMSVITSAYPAGRSMDELDPATGRVRWHVVSPSQAIATTPAGIIITAPGPESGPAAGTYQIGVRHALTGRTRTAELNEPLAAGRTYEASPAPSVFLAGRLLVAPTASPNDTELLAALRISDGHRAWQVTLPGPVEAPVSLAPGGMLVYAGG
jgi:outer membrane protein assembly factor BamB